MKRIAVIFGLLLAGCHGELGARAVRLGGGPDSASLAGDVAASLEARNGGVRVDRVFDTHTECVARRILLANPQLPRDVVVRMLDAKACNAYSLPPGRVYLTQGLCCRLQNDAQLAAVICHELAHVARGDHVRPAPADDNAALEREIAADVLAAEYLAHAGYEALAMREVVGLIEDVEPAKWHARRQAALASAVQH